MVADGPDTGRQTWIDALRLFAGVSMVGLHVTADAQGQPFPDADPAARLAPMVLRALLYTARTELFLMISVMLLLMALSRRPRSYGTVMAEQARRLLIPFVFWTAFYAVYNLLKAWTLGYEAEVFAAAEEQRVVRVVVRVTVTAAVIDDGVVQHGAIAFRGICHLA